MPRTINILPENLANKIAAGEVVQRPASVVKELLENSLDAGSTTLTVIIKDAGKKLIQVIDDGGGMSSEDAAIAFERHATSKISSYEDLEHLRTLGFRGEALASIAAISHVELRTRQPQHEVGTKVRIEGGLLLDISEEATGAGTSVSVKNLFYNTPGRRNFQKSNNTEFKHIVDVVTRIAISHPELSIKFVSDDEVIYNLHASSPRDRLKEIFGVSLTDSLIEFEEQGELGTLRGFLCKPDFARKTRTEQYLFLNNRFIMNKSINHAVFQAYEHLLEKGSFPLFVLFLTIDPHAVDVNVHPSKMEVKFADESSIYRLVLSSVRKSLSTHDLIPTANLKETPFEQEIGFKLESRAVPARQRVSRWDELIRVTAPEDNVSGPPEISADSSQTNFDSFIVKGIENKFEQIHHSPDKSQDTQETQTPLKVRGAAWQFHNKYLLIPLVDSIMIVDQHAAHERVLYERAVNRFSEATPRSQQLLFPQTIEMNAGDIALVQQLLPFFEGLGFNVKVFGKTTLIVDGVPTDVKPGDEATILQDMLDLYKEDSNDIKLEPREKLMKSFSCKAAIKAGDPLNETEMHSLLDQLFLTRLPYSCPHGRPVIITLSLSELDRRFGRTS